MKGSQPISADHYMLLVCLNDYGQSVTPTFLCHFVESDHTLRTKLGEGRRAAVTVINPKKAAESWLALVMGQFLLRAGTDTYRGTV